MVGTEGRSEGSQAPQNKLRNFEGWTFRCTRLLLTAAGLLTSQILWGSSISGELSERFGLWRYNLFRLYCSCNPVCCNLPAVKHALGSCDNSPEQETCHGTGTVLNDECHFVNLGILMCPPSLILHKSKELWRHFHTMLTWLIPSFRNAPSDQLL